MKEETTCLEGKRFNHEKSVVASGYLMRYTSVRRKTPSSGSGIGVLLLSSHVANGLASTNGWIALGKYNW
jgi:hypothetical protein